MAEKERKFVRFNLLTEGDYIAAKAVLEDVDPAFRRYIFAYMQKRLHSIDSFGKYVMRQLIRHGIYVDYSSSITSLPDGFRLTIDVRLTAVDMELARKKLRQMYQNAFDLLGAFRHFKTVERRLEEEATEKTRTEVDIAAVEATLDVGRGSASDSDTGLENVRREEPQRQSTS